MAFVRGKDTQIFITTAAAASVELTAFADDLTVSLDSENLDTTVFGSAYKSSIRGFLGFSGNIAGKYDSAATATPDQWFIDLITAASTVASTITVFPAGSASGRRYDRASVYFSNYAVKSAVDAVVTWSVDYTLATGSVTQGTA